MDNSLKRKIENEFPYPVALEFRRLNTMDFLEQNDKRLKQLLKTSETVMHFLALTALVDLADNVKKIEGGIPEWFKKEFQGRFTRTSFGKWIALFRDSVRLFHNARIPMFIEELPDYFLKNGKGESDAQKAFNALSTMRNNLAHPNTNLTRTDVKAYCIQAEEHFEVIMNNLQFITLYPLRHVDNISVKYAKWHQPLFNHTFAEITGTSTEFNAYKKQQNLLIHTPALIVIKQDENDFLNLDPLIILSDEGSNSITDVFMYMDWDPGKTVKYKPVWNGGDYNLLKTHDYYEKLESLSKFWQFFSDSETAAKYVSDSENSSDISDKEIVKFNFDE